MRKILLLTLMYTYLCMPLPAAISSDSVNPDSPGSMPALSQDQVQKAVEVYDLFAVKFHNLMNEEPGNKDDKTPFAMIMGSLK